jgi:hypothetical protein
LQTHARVNMALRVGSAPSLVAHLCLQLAQANLLGHRLMVIGTNSLYAYEAMAGVRFSPDVMATTDIDLLWSHKARLALGAVPQSIGLPFAEGHERADSLLGLLQKTDKSFKRLENQPFRAANDKGFLVDLIRQMPKPPWKDEPTQIGGEHDLVATDIWNMKWLLNAPHVQQLAIATNGQVFPIAAPDPRAFCAFKFWLSQSDERDPKKKPRDLAQARVVYATIEERLPHLAKAWDDVTSIPKPLRAKIAGGALR